jgi:hypothetical protein
VCSSCSFERDCIIQWVRVDDLFFSLLTEGCPDILADLVLTVNI